MARIGGRNAWIAVPAGLACAAIVAGLVWLAAPAVPGVVQWAGDTLRRATTPVAVEEGPSPAELAHAGKLDCRDLYPQPLWSELLWSREALLSQDVSAPVTGAPDLVDALAPTVRVSCRWTGDTGMVSATLALVAADAATIADPALRGQGFDCAADETALRCARSTGDVTEAHVVRGDLWLVTSTSSWHPDDYTGRLEAYVWR